MVKAVIVKMLTPLIHTSASTDLLTAVVEIGHREMLGFGCTDVGKQAWVAYTIHALPLTSNAQSTLRPGIYCLAWDWRTQRCQHM